MNMIQDNFRRLKLLVVQCPLNGTDKVEVLLNDQDLGSNSDLSKSVFPNLIAFCYDVKNGAVKMALLSLLILLNSFIDGLRVSEGYLTYALALQQLLRLEVTLVNKILKPVEHQVLEIRNLHAKGYLDGLVENLVDFVVIEDLAGDNILSEDCRDDHGVDVLVFRNLEHFVAHKHYLGLVVVKVVLILVKQVDVSVVNFVRLDD